MDKQSTLRLEEILATRRVIVEELEETATVVSRLISKTQDKHARTMLAEAVRLVYGRMPCVHTCTVVLDEGSQEFACQVIGEHDQHEAPLGGDPRVTITWQDDDQAQPDDEVDSAE